jgi:hypothetical protein
MVWFLCAVNFNRHLVSATGEPWLFYNSFTVLLSVWVASTDAAIDVADGTEVSLLPSQGQHFVCLLRHYCNYILAQRLHRCCIDLLVTSGQLRPSWLVLSKLDLTSSGIWCGFLCSTEWSEWS